MSDRYFVSTLRTNLRNIAQAAKHSSDNNPIQLTKGRIKKLMNLGILHINQSLCCIAEALVY